MIEAVVNEVSAKRAPEFTLPAGESVLQARNLMSHFILSLSEGFRLGYVRRLRTDRDFMTLELAADYPLYKWRNDRAVDQVERLALGRFATTSPYLARSIKEVSFGGVIAHGLASCLEADAIAVSWPSDASWNSHHLSVNLLTVREDGELIEEDSAIRNVTDVQHWGVHADWISSQVLREVVDGKSLLGKASELLPQIRFGRGAVGDLVRLNGGERYFSWVVDALLQADRLVRGSDQGSFPHSLLPGPASGESATVRDSPRLRSMRTFENSRGQFVFMEHHMKNLAENKRIYYTVDQTSRTIDIGYVGDHLETANY